MEPAALEGLRGGGGILQVALHHHIAAEHDLAQGGAVRGNGLHRVRIEDVERFEHRIAHALARLERRVFSRRQARPIPSAIR